MKTKGKLLLNVPYGEKDEAKALGARWNPDLKKWYATDGTEYYRFLRWLPKDTFYIVFDSIFLVVANRTCYQCDHLTRVVGFSNPDYISFYNYLVDDDAPEDAPADAHIHDGLILDFEDNISLGEHYIYDRPNPIPKRILEYLQENFNYKIKYSHSKKNSELSNCCEHCDALQGDHFLFNDFTSPYWPQTIEEAKKVEFLEIELEYDLPFRMIDDGVSNQHEVFKPYPQFSKLDLDIF